MVALFRERGSFEACALVLGTSTSNFRKRWWEIVGSKPVSSPPLEPVLQDSTFVLDLDYHHDDFYQVGVCSDVHLTSLFQQPTRLQEFYETCRDRDITTIFMAGDLCEGTGNYRGQPFQTFIQDKRAILDYVVSQYPMIPTIKSYFVGGNHDLSFARSQGFDICKCVAKRRPDMIFKGYRDATLLIGTTRITLHHGAGIASAIRSNRSNIALLGHYHTFKITENFHDAFLVQLGAFHAGSPNLGGIVLTFKDSGKAPTVEQIEYSRIVDDY
jgi:UDP-2,3-diacylglucosamine pyrophosphatase LpxH